MVEAKIELVCPKCGITYKVGSYCLEDGTKLVRKMVLPTDEINPVAVRPFSSIALTSPKGHAISNQNSVKQTAPKIVSASSAQPSSQSNPDKWPLWKWILVFVAVAALMMILDSIGVSPTTRNKYYIL